jgi:hypothetical protein
MVLFETVPDEPAGEWTRRIGGAPLRKRRVSAHNSGSDLSASKQRVRRRRKGLPAQMIQTDALTALDNVCANANRMLDQRGLHALATHLTSKDGHVELIKHKTSGTNRAQNVTAPATLSAAYAIMQRHLRLKRSDSTDDLMAKIERKNSVRYRRSTGTDVAADSSSHSGSGSGCSAGSGSSISQQYCYHKRRAVYLDRFNEHVQEHVDWLTLQDASNGTL